MVVLLGVLVGYGLVVAWQRWGDRAPLPPPVERFTVRVLGPKERGQAGQGTPGQGPGEPRVTDPGQTQQGEGAGQGTGQGKGSGDPQASAEASDTGAETQEIPVAGGQQDSLQAGSSEAQESQVAGAQGPGPAIEGTTSSGDTEAGSPDHKDPDAPVARRPQTPDSERRLEQTFQLDRADAVEEISILFDASYEQANALVKSGLWGMENHEEWARAMRGKNPPPGIPPALFQGVVNSSPKDYHELLEKLRQKRASLKILCTLWGVGPEEAEALYTAGFQDLESIQKSSTDKLARVPGIGHALAFQIRAAAHGLAPTA